MMSDEQRSERTADGRVKDEHYEVSLVVEADTWRREEAVMIMLQYTTVTDLAVMWTGRCHQQTYRTRLKLGKLLLLLLLILLMLIVLVAFTRRSHNAASGTSSLYSLASRLWQSLQQWEQKQLDIHAFSTSETGSTNVLWIRNCRHPLAWSAG